MNSTRIYAQNLVNGSFDGGVWTTSDATWIAGLTTDHIMPLPLLEEAGSPSNINIPVFTAAAVSFCQKYCVGGSFYANNPSANAAYAPSELEIENEPNGVWLHYAVTPAVVQSYADLLISLRAGLVAAGLGNIDILAVGGNDASEWTSTWDT